MLVLIMLSIQTGHFKLHLNTHFETKGPCGRKDKVKRKERNNEYNCLIGFPRGQFLDNKAKTRGIALNIFRVL